MNFFTYLQVEVEPNEQTLLQAIKNDFAQHGCDMSFIDELKVESYIKNEDYSDEFVIQYDLVLSGDRNTLKYLALLNDECFS